MLLKGPRWNSANQMLGCWSALLCYQYRRIRISKQHHLNMNRSLEPVAMLPASKCTFFLNWFSFSSTMDILDLSLDWTHTHTHTKFPGLFPRGTEKNQLSLVCLWGQRLWDQRSTFAINLKIKDQNPSTLVSVWCYNSALELKSAGKRQRSSILYFQKWIHFHCDSQQSAIRLFLFYFGNIIKSYIHYFPYALLKMSILIYF